MVGPTGRFSRSDRLLRPRDFQRVAREGVRHASRHFVVLVASRPPRPAGPAGPARLARRDKGAEGRPRIGVTVSRKVGGAVARNRVKRRVREWFRRSRAGGGLGGSVDLVVIARRGAAELAGPELAAELSGLLEGDGRD